MFWLTNLMLVRKDPIARSKIMMSTTMKTTIKKEKSKSQMRILPHLSKPIISKF